MSHLFLPIVTCCFSIYAYVLLSPAYANISPITTIIGIYCHVNSNDKLIVNKVHVHYTINAVFGMRVNLFKRQHTSRSG